MRRFLLLLAVLAACLGMRAQDMGEHVRLTNLPHIYIDTFTGEGIWSKDIMVLARMWYVDEADNVSFFDSLEVRVRGNSTASLAKKPYKLKFASKVKLLGKGYANTKKWTLLANHGDKTLLRNAITSLMGERAGLPFNPAAKFVDLTINGSYVGNYQLSDQVDVRPHRVNVVEQDYPLTDQSNITGGYLLEVDGFNDFMQGISGFFTNRNSVPVRIHYPDEDEIDHRQYRYIRNYVQEFEDRLYSDSFTDPLTGYRQMVDSTTLANWYICTEVSGNVDGFFSTYFYKEQDDDRLYWGPLWDYDIAYNNDDRNDRGGGNNTEQQLMKDYGYGQSNGCRRWMKKLWEDPWFGQLINRRYQELVDEGLEQYLYDKLDSLTTLIDASQQLNFELWGIRTRALRERVLYSTYGEYVDYVRDYIKNHMRFLTRAFAAEIGIEIEEPPVIIVPDFKADSLSYYAISNRGTHTCFDVDSEVDELCCRQRDENSESQQWHITTLGNGFLFIVNRATGQALSDPSPKGSTATTNVGGNLALALPDSTDLRQQWNFVAQADDYYNIISRWSGHAANLNSGNAADGTRVISYTSNERDKLSSNRLWLPVVAGTMDTGIETPTMDYALAYDDANGRLHFGAENLQQLTFTVGVYNVKGHRVGTFRACDDFNMLPYPAGLYIVTWSENGRKHSVKLKK
ncbi:MAG: CotH kinase family protein [Prevotella sp.]|nr:CotH kinase family protein [Prevotella sp.]